MTTVAQQPVQGADEPIRLRSWKAPVALAVFAVIAVVMFVLLGRDGTSAFRLSTAADLVQLPDVQLPTRGTSVALTIALVTIAVVSVLRARAFQRTPLWLVAVFGVLFIVAFLAWSAADALIPVPGLLIGTLGISIPLIFGALGGVICERVGVVNIAIEGQLLAGAFVAAVVASVTGQPLLGLVGAMVAGVLVSLVLAMFSITYLVDQVIVGVVLNVLVAGLTGFFYSTVLTGDAARLNSPETFSAIPIPILSQIPVIGPALFRQTLLVYVMYIVVAAVAYALFRTRWGLRLRSVGEHPQAADTVGIKVNRTRFLNVSLAGAIAGLGGSYFSLVAVGSFLKDMTDGAGFIALAAVIFGRWNPILATLAALLFGFASNLQSVLSIVGSPLPSEFMLMLPYVVTIIAVAGLVGHVRGPAAAGKPYVKS